MALQYALTPLQQAFVSAASNDVIALKDKKTPGAGGHRGSGSKSVAAIVATFVPTFLTAVLFLAIFVAIRNKYRKIYTPRTYIEVVPEKDRTPLPGRGEYDWFHSFRTLDDKFILRNNSLDAYCFLRFLRTVILLCFVGCCITWPILFPINATGGGDKSQLDRISMSNVSGTTRLWAHAVVAWLFLGFVMVLVARERIFLIGLRQAYLLSKSNAARLSSRTVLFLSAPKEVVNEENLRRIFGDGARKHWVVTDLADLESLVGDRNDSAMILEAADVQWSRNLNKKRLQKSSNSSGSNGYRLEDGGDISSLDKESRPTHRSPMLVGEKVDAIDWSRHQVCEKAKQVQEIRDRLSKSSPKHGCAVFVEFATQAAAQRAYQQLSSHQPLHQNPRYIGVVPKEVIWKNLVFSPTQRISRGYIATAFVAATILLWAIPIGIVGTISNINYLTEQFHFLRFINNLPDTVLGLLTGLLPPYLISEMVSYVPKFFRYIAKLSEPTNSQAELKTQSWYYAFQVIQVFLVTTFTSGAAAVAGDIAKDPASLPTRLAENLPTASNFYITYFILQGTASAANNVLNYSDLLEYLGYDKFFDKTPRAKYSRYTQMKGISWGSVYPKFANMAIIAIAYACIAPLVLGFATVGIFLYYLSYRYNLLFVIQTKVDTKGESYTRALQHLLTGVYLSELCLIGLFGLREATGPSILTAALLIVTIIYHVTMNRYLSPLEQYLPTSSQAEDEETPLLEAEEGSAPATQDADTQPESRIEHIGKGRVPDQVLEPVAQFLEPHVFASHQALKPWFQDPEEDPPEYSEDDIRTAYVNPALTSKTPKLWLVRDEMGISKHEIQENEAVGISSTDEGASLDKKNDIKWPIDDLTKVPLFKMPVRGLDGARVQASQSTWPRHSQDSERWPRGPNPASPGLAPQLIGLFNNALCQARNIDGWTNENNLSLANVKFDFSLVKVDAPAEFAPVGSALTTQRRSEAEDGPQHRTARRLAALFEELIPSTPNLVTAYGRRVSEIIQNPHVNPRGSGLHGPFRDFVGADATAIWAAVTSGIPALGVYLLACLLARAWDATKSVSIWVELVSERRREIEKAFCSNAMVSESSLVGARQEISRHDLALLDASARSWLRSADRGKQWEHDQLRLILENINVPFPGGPSTYGKVMSCWRQAMIGMEDLLLGKPQSIADASVLLALSSWHLFPNLIVLGNKTVNVKFKDALFPSTGVGTIGLTSTSDRDRSVQWSLKLSHLRYYGDPVPVSSRDDFSRVSMEQLCLMAFGSILSAWSINLKCIEAAAVWFRGLWNTLKQNKQRVQNVSLSRRFFWLHLLVQASESLLLCSTEKRQENLSLVKFGYRRGKQFLDADGESTPPYFGLCNPCVLAGLSVNIDIECGIRYLRELAKCLGLDCGQAIIICSHWVNAGAEPGFEGVEVERDVSEDYYEYATAITHRSMSTIESTEGPGVARESLARWIHFDPEDRPRRWDLDKHGNDKLSDNIESREAQIKAQDEQCYVVADGLDWAQARHWDDVHGLRSALCWQKPARLYGGKSPFRFDLEQSPRSAKSHSTCPSLLSSHETCHCFRSEEQPYNETLYGDLIAGLEGQTLGNDTLSNPGELSHEFSPCHFSPILGDRHFGLFIRHLPEEDYLVGRYRQSAIEIIQSGLDPMAGLARLEESSISRARLWDYLCCITNRPWTLNGHRDLAAKSQAPGVDLLATSYRLSESRYHSLCALSSAIETFRSLDGATIAVKLISSSLQEARWVPDLVIVEEECSLNCDLDSSNDQPILQPSVLGIQSRSQAFACITHLVSGTLNIEPTELELTLAMCCEDSIYVAGVLLSDPAEPVASNRMRRLTGNIGQKGISMLIAPQHPRIRSAQDDYRIVTHAAYDLKRDDNFKQTTLHLSFTDWALPLNIGGTNMRTIDQKVYLVESVISVRDRGTWVADLDVLAINFHKFNHLGMDHGCSGGHGGGTVHDYTSIDSWEELLDPPETIGVVRAHGNWVARLAAVSILTQKRCGDSVGVLDGRAFCLKCLESRYAVVGEQPGPFKTYLPAFFID